MIYERPHDVHYFFRSTPTPFWEENQKAFTLIELLVVIAIISLLVSILLPSLTKAREIAAQVTCATQLRNVGVAMHLYAQDNTYFPPCGVKEAPLDDIYWQQKLLPYENESPKGLVCVNFTKRVDVESPTPQYFTDYNHLRWFSTGPRPMYGYNHLALGCGGGAQMHAAWGCVTEGQKVAPEQLVNPAKLGMCYDNGVSLGNPPFLYRSAYEIWRHKELFFSDFVFHLGGLNVLFSDDHAEWTDFDDEEYWFDNDEHWVNE